MTVGAADGKNTGRRFAGPYVKLNNVLLFCSYTFSVPLR